MSEEILMLAVKNGELEKLTLLFEKYQALLYNFFVRMTWDKDLSADLTQNVFLRIIKYKHSFRSDMRFKPWIFQIARNVHADHFRSQHIFSDKHDLSQLEAEDDDSLKFQLEQEETLQKAVNLLELSDRELIVMSKFQKMKYEEIGAVLGISVASVKVRVHRAIKKLRKVYFELENA